MKKRVLIVGAGGFGRECLAWARSIPAEQRDWEVAGFLDDTEDPLDGIDCGVPVLGRIADYQPKPDELLLMAIGSVKGKLELGPSLLKRGAQFLTLVHPSAIVGERVRLGTGSVLCPNVVISADVNIGAFVALNICCSVGHDAIIGDGSTLSSHVDITAGVDLGRGVFVGSRASVLPNVSVGDFATVGAGSIVTRTVKNRNTVFGMPARVLIAPGD